MPEENKIRPARSMPSLRRLNPFKTASSTTNANPIHHRRFRQFKKSFGDLSQKYVKSDSDSDSTTSPVSLPLPVRPPRPPIPPLMMEEQEQIPLDLDRLVLDLNFWDSHSHVAVQPDFSAWTTPPMPDCAAAAPSVGPGVLAPPPSFLPPSPPPPTERINKQQKNLQLHNHNNNNTKQNRLDKFPRSPSHLNLRSHYTHKKTLTGSSTSGSSCRSCTSCSSSSNISSPNSISINLNMNPTTIPGSTSDVPEHSAAATPPTTNTRDYDLNNDEDNASTSSSSGGGQTPPQQVSEPEENGDGADEEDDGEENNTTVNLGSNTNYATLVNPPQQLHQQSQSQSQPQAQSQPPPQQHQPQEDESPSSSSFSIRLTPFVDHSSSIPALYIGPVERKIEEGMVIRVGRYTDKKDDGKTNAESAPIVFKSKVVSRSHAEFFVKEGVWYIRDIKSSSGTFLNHMRLSPACEISDAHAINDGDVLQLGMDFRGGSEEVFKCIKVRLELNESWKRKVNNFNVTAMNNLKNIFSTKQKDLQECAICLLPVSPLQALFVAPCSHTWHYKCIRPLIVKSYPHFLCPNCRTICDLEADIEIPDLTHLQEAMENTTIE